MPPQQQQTTEEAEAQEGGNADNRSSWFANLFGFGEGKGRRRATPGTVPVPPAPPPPTPQVWVPAGPALVRNGQAIGTPSVSGRVLDIAVAPGGNRAYVATADGGVWRYTRTTAGGGPPIEKWVPLHDDARSADLTTTGANALATGAIAVRWGAGPAADRLFIGTGEVHPNTPRNATDPPQVAGGFSGVGVRTSTGEPGLAGVAYEALDLDGEGVFRLVLDPDDPQVVWAATSEGLMRRPASGERSMWDQIIDPSFPADDWFVTDLAITGSGGSKVVWAAFWHRGVWRLPSGGPWAQVAGITANATVPGRIALAAAHEAANANAVYALDSTGKLYRYDGSRFRLVTQTPPKLVSGQGWYDLAVEVAPGNPNQVILAGDTVRNPGPGNEDPDWEASLYVGTLTGSAPSWRFGFTAANNARDNHHRDPTYLGEGIHADLHRVTFGRNADGTMNPNDVWIGCDGGVFRSEAGPVRARFRSLNAGLASIQLNHLASHPRAEATVLAGSQDNGVVRRSGDGTWFEEPKGDGGGVAIDPDNPARWACQYTTSSLNTSFVGGVAGEWRPFDVPVSSAKTGTKRNERPEFYSGLWTSPPGTNPMLLLYATHRIWASHNWGVSWVTLPSGTRPTNSQFNQDRLTTSREHIWAVVPASATVIYAATTNGVFRLDRTAASPAGKPAGVWSTTALPTTGLPGANRAIRALAVAGLAPESLYVGLARSSIEHVYWYDAAASTWRPTGLSPTGGANVDAPVSCLALDPGQPRHLYAGTPLGVWQGERAADGSAAWTWRAFSQELPEAAVLDLEVAVYGAGPTSRRLLRAATHGRGMWERDLTNATTPNPDLHLRMNTLDGGRRHPAMRSGTDPDRWPAVPTTWSDSPDIRLRRGSTATVAPAWHSVLRRTFTDPRPWGGPNKRPIGFLQQHIARRGVTIPVNGAFDAATEAAVQTLQRRWAITSWHEQRWAPNGRVDRRTWDAITAAPPMAAAIDLRVFAEDVREDIDEATGAMLADATGTSRLFAQIHVRGPARVPAADVRVALLLAPLTGTPAVAPQLPAGWAERIRTGATGWTGASGWVLAGGGSPYRRPRDELHDMASGVVEWPLDFAALGFSAAQTVLALVAVHATSQPLTTNERNPRAVVEALPAVAARRIRLDPVTAIAAP